MQMIEVLVKDWADVEKPDKTVVSAMGKHEKLWFFGWNRKSRGIVPGAGTACIRQHLDSIQKQHPDVVRFDSAENEANYPKLCGEINII